MTCATITEFNSPSMLRFLVRWTGAGNYEEFCQLPEDVVAEALFHFGRDIKGMSSLGATVYSEKLVRRFVR